MAVSRQILPLNCVEKTFTSISQDIIAVEQQVNAKILALQMPPEKLCKMKQKRGA